MTLTDCQIFITVSQLGTFAAAAEQMHLLGRCGKGAQRPSRCI